MDDGSSKLTIVLTLVGIVVALAVGTGGLNIWMLSTMFGLQETLLANQYAVEQQARDLEEIKKQIDTLSTAFGEAPARIQAAALELDAALSGLKGLPTAFEDLKEVKAGLMSIESELQGLPEKIGRPRE